MNKEYLKISGIIHNSQNWNDDRQEQFLDQFISLVESFGGELQCSCTIKAITEEELEDEEF